MLPNMAVEGKGVRERVRISELCSRKKCSLRRAAAEMAISPSLLSNYQSGRIRPGLRQLLVIARYFRVMRLDELVEIRESRAPRRMPRLRPFYTRTVTVPIELRPLVWDSPDGKAPMEKVVMRALTRGDFNQIRLVCRKFPAAARRVAESYPDIRRGVRYWVRRLDRESRRG